MMRSGKAGQKVINQRMRRRNVNILMKNGKTLTMRHPGTGSQVHAQNMLTVSMYVVYTVCM